MTPKSPAELAKETLLRLAEKRLPPTPEHFTRMYCTLAGIPEPIPERFQKLLDLPWHDLIRRLIAAWELPHREWTTEMKRRSLERVLATRNPERLFERLNNLVEAWKRAPTRDERENDSEFKQLTGQRRAGSSLVREFPTNEGEPYYPVPTKENEQLFKEYQALQSKIENVSFVGRLAQYRYYNMDQVIGAALTESRRIIERLKVQR